MTKHIDEILKNPDLVWKNKDISPTERGRIIEEIKARTEYKNYDNVGKAKGGNLGDALAIHEITHIN